MSLPTVVGDHVVATADGVDYRIGCAGSGRWTVTSRSDEVKIYATLELTAGLYTYAQAGERGDMGEDWKELVLRRPR